MDTRLPDGFQRMRDDRSTSNQNRLKVVVTDKTVALVLASMALGISTYGLFFTSRDYRELEREVRLQQLKLDEYRVALMKADIEPNPHVEGESK